MGVNPLCGPVAFGRERFVDLTQAYDSQLGALMGRAARSCRIRLRQGVYLAVSGPSYETPAEIRAFAKLGADAVGMSTVPEVTVARQCGLNVAALSCITNLASGLGQARLSHAEVLAAGRRVQCEAVRLLERFAKYYGKH
jgi:purine-nucleoside phosphorylase